MYRVKPPLLLLLWVCLSLSLSGQAEPMAMTFGVVPQFSSRHVHRVWAPLLDVVGERSGVDFQLEVPEDIPAFAEALYQGRFDLAYVNPLQFHRVRDRYRPLIRDHGRSLEGILVTSRESGVADWSALEGRRIVFPAHAYAAASLMQAVLHQRGVRFLPVYVPNHASVYLGVAMGLYAAGGGVRSTLAQQPARLRGRLRVIGESPSSPPHPVVAHRRVEAGLQERIRGAFLSVFEANPELFEGIPMWRPGSAEAGDYDGLMEVGR